MDNQRTEALDLRQAVRWSLLTSRINLSADAAFVPDFEDVGGLYFTYLPYPDQYIYNGEGECGDGIDCPEHIAPSGAPYKSWVHVPPPPEFAST